MRKRMLHENICESEKLDSVSWRANVLYVRLLTKVDDHGNFYGDSSLIKLACFPYKKIQAGAVGKTLGELVAAGLFTRYQAGSKQYIHLNRFEDFQKLQRKFPKFPRNPVSDGFEKQDEKNDNNFERGSKSQVVPDGFDNQIENNVANNGVPPLGLGLGLRVREEEEDQTTPSPKSSQSKVQTTSDEQLSSLPTSSSNNPPNGAGGAAAASGAARPQRFDPLVYDQLIGDHPAAEVRRVMYYQFKVNENDWWRNQLNTEQALRAKFEKALADTPTTFEVPRVADPSCTKCSGAGFVPFRRKGKFPVSVDCECVKSEY